MLSKRDAEILASMAGGDKERAIELWIKLPTDHQYKYVDIAK